MLQVHDVNRSYGKNHVLHDVSFGAARGRLTGFVGGNGAGKTTTMRIILGVLSPDSGHVTLDGTGLDATTRHRFGYMPEERGLYPKMGVATQVAYLARLHGYSARDAQDRAHGLLDRLGLTERRDSPLESLSLGNQQRVQIAAALVHGPEVLVLDEPFSGLDPHAVDVVLTVLTEHAAAGAIVLFSSHQLDVVERLCDDIVIISDGRVVASGATGEVRAQHAEPSFVLESPADLDWVAAEPGIDLDDTRPGRVVFRAGDDDAQRVLARAVSAGPVTTFAPRLPTLAETFKHITTTGGASR